LADVNSYALVSHQCQKTFSENLKREFVVFLHSKFFTVKFQESENTITLEKRSENILLFENE